jgi:hypothetical protein
MRRVLLTLFLLPLSVILLMPVFFMVSARQLDWTTVVQGLWFGAYATTGTLPLSLIGGAPLLLLAAWRRWWKPWHFMLGGAALVGALPLWSALRLLQDERLHLWYRLETFQTVWPWFVGGLAYGLVFWIIAIRGNSLALSHPQTDPLVESGSRSGAA